VYICQWTDAKARTEDSNNPTEYNANKKYQWTDAKARTEDSNNRTRVKNTSQILDY